MAWQVERERGDARAARRDHGGGVERVVAVAMEHEQRRDGRGLGGRPAVRCKRRRKRNRLAVEYVGRGHALIVSN